MGRAVIALEPESSTARVSEALDEWESIDRLEARLAALVSGGKVVRAMGRVGVLSRSEHPRSSDFRDLLVRK